MELFQAKDHYILQQGERALWCSRRDGGLQLRPATDLLLAWNPICLGLVEGVIGKIQLHSAAHFHPLIRLVRMQTLSSYQRHNLQKLFKNLHIGY